VRRARIGLREADFQCETTLIFLAIQNFFGNVFCNDDGVLANLLANRERGLWINTNLRQSSAVG
jgi:hypothetical protein